ncbi:formate dehydrogenase subunit gamma [Derxia gummosa]|uniref:Formate dehydrogenase subunit gamma n=1 Tax=Derxia gummosa DSM 723 TaxID=1121388 RepID=A0A9U5C4V8_9BURK|nr:formate dehydrogenase subunit gamma [Derxia gummosa]
MKLDLDALRALIATHADTPGGLMPALHAVQAAIGHVPPEVVPLLADTFNLSRAEVHGVVTFYHHFRQTPPGLHQIEVCRAESCQAMGSDALEAHVEHKLGCKHHDKSADGRWSLEPVYCLGLCAMSPAIAIDGQPHARMTPEKFDRLVAALGDGAQ